MKAFTRDEYRRAAWLLRRRLMAIRETAKKGQLDQSQLDWQLGSLQNELERAFRFRSGDFDAMIHSPKATEGTKETT